MLPWTSSTGTVLWPATSRGRIRLVSTITCPWPAPWSRAARKVMAGAVGGGRGPGRGRAGQAVRRRAVARIDRHFAATSRTAAAGGCLLSPRRSAPGHIGRGPSRRAAVEAGTRSASTRDQALTAVRRCSCTRRVAFAPRTLWSVSSPLRRGSRVPGRPRLRAAPPGHPPVRCGPAHPNRRPTYVFHYAPRSTRCTGCRFVGSPETGPVSFCYAWPVCRCCSSRAASELTGARTVLGGGRGVSGQRGRFLSSAS